LPLSSCCIKESKESSALSLKAQRNGYDKLQGVNEGEKREEKWFFPEKKACNVITSSNE
jgi:hypothetical protein